MRKLTKEERATQWASEGVKWPVTVSMFAIEQQDARELPLVEALRFYARTSISPKTAVEALAKWEALDAAPKPTLLEAAKAAVGSHRFEANETARFEVVPTPLFDALRVAVERAEREGKS